MKNSYISTVFERCLTGGIGLISVLSSSSIRGQTKAVIIRDQVYCQTKVSITTWNKPGKNLQLKMFPKKIAKTSNYYQNNSAWFQKKKYKTIKCRLQVCIIDFIGLSLRSTCLRVFCKCRPLAVICVSATRVQLKAKLKAHNSSNIKEHFVPNLGVWDESRKTQINSNLGLHW